jgi:hypothetical protein
MDSRYSLYSGNLLKSVDKIQIFGYNRTKIVVVIICINYV